VDQKRALERGTSAEEEARDVERGNANAHMALRGAVIMADGAVIPGER